MFSGKSEELIRRLRRAQIARQQVRIFKPKIDDRYDPIQIVSHSSLRIESIPVTTAADIERHIRSNKGHVDVVGIDEAQFFDEALLDVVDRLADRGMRVLLAGLDQDYLGRPFGIMPKLLAIAESITKQLAVCMVCGAPASRSQRVHPDAGRLSVRPDGTFDEENASTVLVGAAESYEARCRRCFVRGVEVPSRPPL
jgi:thymidine kinase